MNCSHCRDVVLDIARGIAHADEAMALDHLNECEACGRYLQQQRNLSAGLSALAAGEDDIPSSALEQRLLAAIATLPAAETHDGPPAASRFGFGGWLKIAATVALVASAIVFWQWRTRAPGPSTTAPTASGRSGVAAVTERTPAAHEARPSEERQATARAEAVNPALAGGASRTPARRNVRPRAVVLEEFVTLPAASMLPPFERGEIVRVRIQVASLASLGFTVQPDAADTTPINADLLVGQDGQPRAIRLVTNVIQASSRSMR